MLIGGDGSSTNQPKRKFPYALELFVPSSTSRYVSLHLPILIHHP
jgi:hypothetical protein